MVIFNSYVKLPEGTCNYQWYFNGCVSTQSQELPNFFHHMTRWNIHQQ